MTRRRTPEPAWPWQPDDAFRAAHPNGPVLAIVGSRKFLNPNAYSLALEAINWAIIQVQPGLVISGGADGLDSFAKGMAGLFRVPFEPFLPQLPRWEPDGYKARNDLIAAACTHLLCIRCQGSATQGSTYTAGVAESLGRAVQVVTIPIAGWFVTGANEMKEGQGTR